MQESVDVQDRTDEAADRASDRVKGPDLGVVAAARALLVVAAEAVEVDARLGRSLVDGDELDAVDPCSVRQFRWVGDAQTELPPPFDLAKRVPVVLPRELLDVASPWMYSLEAMVKRTETAKTLGGT